MVKTKDHTSATWREEMLEDMKDEYTCPREWYEGPVKNHLRTVTDKLCCIIFIAMVLTMAATGVWVWMNANTKDITRIYDSSGNDCGSGKAEGYPILYLQTFSKPYKSVCVKSCTPFDYNAIKYGIPAPKQDTDEAKSINPEYPGSMFIKEFAKTGDRKSYTSNPNMDEKEAFSYNPDFIDGYFTENDWKKYLNTWQLDCFPNQQVSSCKFKEGSFYIYDSYNFLDTVCVPQSPKAALLFNKVSAKLDAGAASDLMQAKHLFIYCALIALGLSIAFLILSCLMTSLIVWVMMIGLGLVLIVFGSYTMYTVYYPGPLNDAFNPARIKYLTFLFENKTYITILSVIIILAGIFMIILICRKHLYIRITVPILSLALKSSLRNILLIILSVVILCLQMGVLFYEIYMVILIYSSAKFTHENTQGSPFGTIHLSGYQKFLLVLHVFGTYWVLIFLNNFNDFVCAAINVNHYYQRNKPDGPNKVTNTRILCHTLGHHIGSIAWSIILLPTHLLKIVFGWVDFLLTSDNPNGCQKFFNKILCPCCWCYEKFIDRFSESAFPMVYMGSENFWKASTRQYYLSEKYADMAQILNFVGGFFGLVGNLMICIFTGWIGYLIYMKDMSLQQNVDNVGTTLFVCFAIGFVVGSLFVNLFSTSYDALVMCYLIENNIRDEYGLQIEHAPEEVIECIEKLETTFFREEKKRYIPLKERN